MEKTYIIYKELPFYKLLDEEYKNTYYTGMHLIENEIKKYIFKSEDETYYYITITEEDIELLHKIRYLNIKERHLSINEITKFFSKYQDRLKIDKEYINKKNNNKKTIKQRTLLKQQEVSYSK